MATIPITVTVEQSTYQTGLAVAKFIADCQRIIAANPGPIIESIQLAQAVLADLMPALAAVQSLPDDFKEDPYSDITTLALVGQALVKAILVKG